jgi:hypothetical protein
VAWRALPAAPARAAEPETGATSGAAGANVRNGANATAERALPANVALSLDTPSTRGAWKMRVTNRGDLPVILAADARLLSLDITPRSARSVEHCQLPQDMRPQDDLQRPLVLPPGRSYAERFEPRLYCLDGNGLDALAPGATVVATLGWRAPRANDPRPPHVLAPVEGTEARVAPTKWIASLPVVLPDEPTPAPAPRELGVTAAALRGEASLSLRSSRAIDAATPGAIAIPVTLTNEGRRAAIVRFRPETLAFEVVGPAGTAHCAWGTLPSAPTRELFATLGPGQQTSLTVMLAAYCPGPVVAQPGLYVVRASFDARRASGAEIGIRSFDGQVIATAPTIVRVRKGTRVEPLGRPSLQPE